MRKMPLLMFAPLAGEYYSQNSQLHKFDPELLEENNYSNRCMFLSEYHWYKQQGLLYSSSHDYNYSFE